MEDLVLAMGTDPEGAGTAAMQSAPRRQDFMRRLQNMGSLVAPIKPLFFKNDHIFVHSVPKTVKSTVRKTP